MDHAWKDRSKMCLVRVLVLGLVATGSGAAAQQVSSPVLELSYADVGEMPGAELGVGYRYGFSNVVVSGVVGGFIHENEDDRYYQDSSVDRCRDSTNGQFADDSNCGPGVSGYARLEAVAQLNRFEIGAGYRFGEDDGNPYATASYEFRPGFALKINGGEDYIGVGLTFRR